METWQKAAAAEKLARPLQQAIKFTRCDHGLKLAPAGYVMPVHENLRHEIHRSAPPVHLPAGLRIDKLLPVPEHFMRREGQITRSKIIHGLVTKTADIGVKNLNVCMHGERLH